MRVRSARIATRGQVGPFCAQGRPIEATLSSSISEGENRIYIPRPIDWNYGDRVFVGNSDFTNVEYLGMVVTINNDSLVTTLPAARSHGDTSIVWRPAKYFIWRDQPILPIERTRNEGIVAERSAGGALWSVRVAAPSLEVAVRFRGVVAAEYETFREWIDDELRGGLDDFTWVDERRKIARVRLLETRLEVSPDSPAEPSVLHVRYAVLAEKEYA
jgi:hypothetical protein